MSRAVCDGCGHPQREWSRLIHSERDGLWRCAGCNFLELQALSAATREDHCTECAKTVNDHMREFEAIVTRVGWWERFGTRREP